MLNKLQDKKRISLFAVLAIFLLVFFLFADFGIRYVLVYSLMGIVFVLGLFSMGVLHLTRKPHINFGEITRNFTPLKTCYLFMVAVMTVFAILSISNWTHLTMSFTMSMLVLSCFVFFAVPTEKELRVLFLAFQIMAIVFSCYILLVRIHPDFYWKLIYPILSPGAQSEAEDCCLWDTACLLAHRRFMRTISSALRSWSTHPVYCSAEESGAASG